jgi:hypothetical protein
MRRHSVSRLSGWSGRRHSDKCRYSDRRIKRDTSCRLADADKSVGDILLCMGMDGGGFLAIEAAFILLPTLLSGCSTFGFKKPEPITVYPPQRPSWRSRTIWA